MTKRMLSLLLALVMTLSLCVPALAADEFAAEVVTEVEEQAPEAPVEPEAPEAEEPVEEPVVDEPAEEADAPEIAAAMEEEDLPLLVALGVVTKEAHWELYKAVQAAEELLPKVKAGELFAKDFEFTFPADIGTYAEDPEEEDPFKEADKGFAEELERAKAYLDGIDGVEVEYNVTTSTVTDEAGKLNAYIPEVGEATHDLTDTLGNSMNMETIKSTLETDAVASSTKSGSTLTLSIAKTTDVTTDAAWKKVYHSDYLSALQAAIDAVNNYPAGAKYADFTAAIKLMLNALVLEKSSANPAASDMPALDAAISKAESANKNYDANDYVLGGKADYNLDTLIAIAKGYKGDTTGLNGFSDGASYFKVNDVIEKINNALTKKADTIQYESHKQDGVSKNTVNVTVSVTDVPGTEAADGDGNKYAYAWQVNGLWYAGDKQDGTKTLDKAKGVKEIENSSAWTTDADAYPGKYIGNSGTVALKNVGTDEPEFKGSDKITLHFYEVHKNGNLTSYIEITSKAKTFTVSEGYDGPVLQKAEIPAVDDYHMSATITDIGTTALVGGSYNIGWNNKTGDTAPIDITATLSKQLDSGAKAKLVVAVGKDKVVEKTDSLTSSKTIEFAAASTNDEVYLVAGDIATVTLMVAPSEVAEPKADDYIAHGVVSLKVDALSKWSQVPAIKKVLVAAGKLVQSDYDMSDGTRYDVHTVAEAFSIINRDISKINSNITSTTMANTAYNRNATAKILDELVKVCSYLEKKPAVLSELEALLVEAGEKLAADDAGKTDYSFDSIGALRDLYDKYTGDGKLDAEDLQSVVDAAADEVEAALKALTGEVAPDKTALKDSIAKAGALKEEDYTPESWAAAKPAIDEAVKAAQAVVDNEKATQAQVTNALNALNAAMATLVPVEPEGPVAPASGTGWVLDDGVWYFFKNGEMKKGFWVGKADGASAWDGNWYYVGADGKMATGMQYIDDLHGGYGWYFLQPTNANGEIGKMLTGWQWVGGQYGTCYFSAKNGEAGKCTYSTELGNWNGTGWVK